MSNAHKSVVISYDALYFCSVHCNFSVFISNFVDLSPLPLFIYLFIYLLAALGLHCCARAFSSCGERGLLLVAVCGLLITVASLCCGAWALGPRAAVVVARGLSSCGLQALERRLSSCGAQA